ncbi:Outer membrane protein assembly factor BamB, contains PQQ-like beta-propeller repeat [Mariniphaga anaerophila]|uniref:Outer membrane protein assembly factor BamB, contains PQQ-like beta-propeller repeat n=1 Tax=Mariniphaga anaerophila TaxID=1484053 RepID=A0A1M5F4F8_9BACT|nr:PQQ-binding-like beta-propeller repeat protein [Mariniphaga anaerophila]SHF86268.1 Outer membrane protein assembly factor BamB, contains PQQ-like beta-propeller repeat [Mariniphaga anaerophila]
MKTLNFSVFAIFVGVSLLLFSCSIEKKSEWPGWRGVNRDGVVHNFQSPEEWPAELTKVWEQNVGLCDASSVMADGRIFLHVKQGGNEVTLCLDADTGVEIWRTINNASPEVTGGAAPHPGSRSTPYISGKYIYTLGVGGALNCLNIENGDVVWKNEEYTEVPAFFVSMSPIVVDNKCIVHLGGHDSGIIVAFDAQTGEKNWTIKGEPATYSSPVLMEVGSEQVLAVQSETDLLGVSLDGDLLWKIPTPGERRFYNSSTPVVDGQNIFIAGQGIGTRSVKIEKLGDKYTWTENWYNPDFGVSFNTPVLKEGFLYGHEARLGKAFCLNAATGEVAWADTVSHNRFTSTLDLGNEILSLTANGKLLVFEPTPYKYSEKAAYKVSSTNTYAHPLVSGNRIYTKDKETFTCWEVL